MKHNIYFLFIFIGFLTLISGCIENNTNPTTTTTTIYITTTTYYIHPKETTSSTSSVVKNIETTTTIEKTTTTTYIVTKPTGEKRRTIASWNIQRYGPTKAANTDIVKSIASRVNDYDIVILQEITDSSGSAFNKLCTYLNDYKCIASDRVGNGTYKEQYGIIYKDAELLEIKYIATNTMAREPLWLKFKSGNWTFNLITAHTKPTNDQMEIATLDNIFNQPTFQNDTILIGDLNADCTYYSRNNEFKDWLWTIPDNADTTVGKSDCAYDRLIINKAAQNNFYQSGIDNSISSDISDHYLIYGVFDNSVE